MNEEPVVNHLCETRTPFVWDKWLPPGKIAQDELGLWHVGEGTDLNILLFEVKLTKADRRFLRSLKVKP